MLHGLAGCTGAADAAIFVLAAGDGVGDSVSALLRADGELDGLSHKCPLC